MIKKENFVAVLGHFAAFCLSIILTALSDQSPRVLLYAHVFSLLFRIVTVWLFAKNYTLSGVKGWMTMHCSREPRPWERSVPYRNEKTRKLAGIGTYAVAVLTLLFMIGVLQMLGSGSGFLKKNVLVPEIIWAALIAVIYWVNDLHSRQFIISSKKSLPVNLGYNVSGMNFLLAAIFISSFALPAVSQIVIWFSQKNTLGRVFLAEWMVLIVLTAMRFISDVLRDLKKNEDSFRNLSRI